MTILGFVLLWLLFSFYTSLIISIFRNLPFDRSKDLFKAWLLLPIWLPFTISLYLTFIYYSKQWKEIKFTTDIFLEVIKVLLGEKIEIK